MSPFLALGTNLGSLQISDVLWVHNLGSLQISEAVKIFHLVAPSAYATEYPVISQGAEWSSL